MRAPVIATGSNSKGDLRAWLAQLVGEGRLAVATENLSLRHELAAVAKRLEREQAVLFPKPDGHAVPVVANLLADRSWVADAIGVPERELLSRFEHAARHPLPCVEVTDAPVQAVHGDD